MALRFFNGRSDERGAILIMAAIVVVGLLTFAGLAIDAGNLYRAQLAAQNAADASALAMVNFVTMRGRLEIEREASGGDVVPARLDERSDLVTAHLREHAEQLAWANMSNAGFPHVQDHRPVLVQSRFRFGDTATNPADPSFDYTVEVYRDVDYYILGSIPFINRRFSGVRASATSDRKIANVALLLDVSGSLACPKTGSCDCLKGIGSPCPETDRKYDDLVDAVRDFVKLFDLENDRVSLVPYNIAAKTMSMGELRAIVGATGAATDREIELIADYLREVWKPTGPTNICDAMLEASSTMNRVAPNQSISYVLFSDGAPTAGRFLFADDTVVKSGLEKANLGYGDYDYSMYTIDWQRDPENVREGEPDYYSGPSPLIQSAALSSVKTDEVGVYIDNPAAPPRPTGDPRCKDELDTAPKVTRPSDLDDAVYSVVRPCLRSLKSKVPGDPHRTYGSEYADGTTSPRFLDWRKQYYHCAIEISDFLRINREATFYSVGLGEPAAGAASSDPYSNISESLRRKDIFLSRVSLDLKSSNNLAPVDSFGNPNRQRFDYSEYRDYDDLSSASNRQYGLYLPTHNSTELRLMFQQIARKVLLRLVS